MLETKNCDKTIDDPTVEYEAFNDLLKHVLSVPKSELDEREAEYRKKQPKQHSRKKQPVTV
jgi:hypothetical protein